MDVCVLASGSDANATLIRSGSTTVLIDCGLPLRRLSQRLARVDCRASDINAVFLTHEHHDHTRGLAPLLNRHFVPAFATPGTAGRLITRGPVNVMPLLETGAAFHLEDLELQPFSVSHRAAEPVGFRITDGRSRLGFATDIGSVTADVLAALGGCDTVVLESNHDQSMLMNGPYPPFLKDWISGPDGHLSNEDAASTIELIAGGRLRHLVLAHLSLVNNDPGISLRSASRALERAGSMARLSLGRHDDVGEVVEMG